MISINGAIGRLSLAAHHLHGFDLHRADQSIELPRAANAEPGRMLNVGSTGRLFVDGVTDEQSKSNREGSRRPRRAGP
jgi:hypothetical protein